MPAYTIDTQICSQCSGRCCQGHPGLWSDPVRFMSIFFAGTSPNKEKIENGLQNHNISLRDVGGIEIPAPLKNGNGCTFLSPTGCQLIEQDRPCQCLALEPLIDTLLNDDICCNMPPSHGTNTARDNWRKFWIKGKQD